MIAASVQSASDCWFNTIVRPKLRQWEYPIRPEVSPAMHLPPSRLLPILTQSKPILSINRSLPVAIGMPVRSDPMHSIYNVKNDITINQFI